MAMKLSIALIIVMLVPTSALLQQPSPAPTPVIYSEKTLQELVKLRKAALASDYAYSQTRYLTNNIGPRLTGSAQAQRSVEYVADEMRKAGLEVTL